MGTPTDRRPRTSRKKKAADSMPSTTTGLIRALRRLARDIAGPSPYGAAICRNAATRLETLAQAVQDYGAHAEDCGSDPKAGTVMGACTCGFHAALELAED